MTKRALITGITGQDGSYLAELLIKKGYQVFGLVRRVAMEDTRHRMKSLLHIKDQITFLSGSMESYPSIYNAVKTSKPDEVYHLAAQSYVSYNFDDEFTTLNANINGTHYILASCKDLVPDTKFYFAATSEVFGNVKNSPQDETTHFHPRSSYGISKTAGFHLTKNYRENYNMFTSSGILFNHESPRRGFEFVTRKITSHAARIKLGLEKKITLGNIEAKRDWGHAKEYVVAMWLMLQKEKADDYVISTGVLHSVKELLEISFGHLDLDYTKYLEINQDFYRPAETIPLLGKPDKAKQDLGWTSEVSFEDLIIEMVDNDMKILKS